MEKDREAIIEKAAELCEQNRLKGFHCSESSILAVSEALGIDLPPDMLKVSSGFRGGGGGYGDRCGVVESAIMLISYLYGRTDPKTDESGYSYLIRLLHNRFQEELGSYYCRVLRPFAFYLSGEKQDCSYIYQNGARIAANLLLDADRLLAEMPEHEKHGFKKAKMEEYKRLTGYPCAGS